MVPLIPGYLFTAVLGFFIMVVYAFDEFYENEEYSYLYMSDDNNIMRRVYSFEPVDEAFIQKLNVENTNMYYLFTRNNPYVPEILLYENEKSLHESYFDATKITVFIIHGWFGNRYSTVNTLLTEGIGDGDVNVIVVDWREAAEFNYWTAKAAVPSVGRHIGRFITWLTSYGLIFDKVHLVGHSLGAHVAGNAGRETESKVRRITGLDPAGPFWDKSPNRLVKTDGQYVEVIHTNTKCLGYKGTTGDADFFPNGGHFMPHCFTNVCSHSQSYYYMAETIKHNDLYGLPCSSIVDVHLNDCNGDPYLMGNSDLTKNRSGVFRVETNIIPKISEAFSLHPELKTLESQRFFSFLGISCFW